MNHSFHVRAIAICIALSCVSCGDDPELVVKCEHRLEAEIIGLEERKRSLQAEYDSYRVKHPLK